MKNPVLEQRIKDEMLAMLNSNKSLHIASIGLDGLPYSSYAPYAVGEHCIYVLLSEIALHGINLQHNPYVSVLIIEDEKTAAELFARLRINYRMKVTPADYQSELWQQGINTLQQRHGERIANLSMLNDFKLFRLTPEAGRYVKGFGKAYSFSGSGFFGDALDHLRDGHQQRSA